MSYSLSIEQDLAQSKLSAAPSDPVSWPLRQTAASATTRRHPAAFRPLTSTMAMIEICGSKTSRHASFQPKACIVMAQQELLPL